MATDILKMHPGYGNNYIAQVRDINSKIKDFGDESSLSEEQLVTLKGLKSAKTETILGAVGTGITGALDLANQFYQNSQGEDMTPYDARLENIASRRGKNYYTNSSILQDYISSPQRYNLDVSELNPSAFESAKQIGTSTLSGAATGFQIGGVPGGIIGGVAGLVSGAGADIIQRTKNSLNTNIFNREQDNEIGRSQYSLTTGVDQAERVQNRMHYGVRLATGGYLKPYNNMSKRLSIQRKHCKGGTLIRIKTK